MFKDRNALDNVQKLHVGYFWKHLDKYKKLNWYARLARLRHSGIYDFYAQSKRFFFNYAWRRRLIPYLPNLDIYLTLIVNVQRVQQLLEMKMTRETSNELARIADYLDLVLLDGIPFRLLNQWFRFFIELFAATNIPFVSITLSVMMTYFFKDYARMLCKSNVMPSLSEYMEVFQEWSARAYETKFYSDFACMQLQVVPPLRELHDIFPGRFGRLINAWQPLKDIGYLRMMKLFPALIHEDDDDLRACIALIRQAQALRHIRVPRQFIQHHEVLLRKLIKILMLSGRILFNKVAVVIFEFMLLLSISL